MKSGSMAAFAAAAELPDRDDDPPAVTFDPEWLPCGKCGLRFDDDRMCAVHETTCAGLPAAAYGPPSACCYADLVAGNQHDDDCDGIRKPVDP